jgi:peptidoglycan/xylan/chitin deacetylase (PgdA/CDA1 family)
MTIFPKVLLYHSVIGNKYSIKKTDYGAHSIDEFKLQMKFLKKILIFITADEFVSKIKEKKTFKKKECLLTIDDGYRNIICNILPVLEEWQIPALIFINDAHIRETKWLWFNRFHALRLRGEVTLERLQDFAQLNLKETNALLEEWGAPDANSTTSKTEQELFDGMNEKELSQLCTHPLITIGGHTSAHLRMPNETNEVLLKDIKDNKTYLEQFTGYPLQHFAYPEGFTDQRSSAIVSECGYRYGYMATPVKPKQVDLLAIPRIGIYRSGIVYLAAKLIRGYR